MDFTQPPFAGGGGLIEILIILDRKTGTFRDLLIDIFENLSLPLFSHSKQGVKKLVYEGNTFWITS